MSSVNEIKRIDYIMVIILLVASTVLFSTTNIVYYTALMIMAALFTIITFISNNKMAMAFRLRKNINYLLWLIVFFIFIAVHYYFVHWDSFSFLRRMRIWLPSLLMVLWLMRIDDKELLVFYGKCCVLASIPIFFIVFSSIEFMSTVVVGERFGDVETGLNGNMIALNMLFLFFFSLILYNKEPRWRTLTVIVLIMQVAIILFTGCRRAVIAVFVLYIIYSLRFGNKTNRLWKLMISMAIVILLVYLMIEIDFLYEVVGFRILKLLNDVGLVQLAGGVDATDYSAEVRREFIPIAVSLFKDNPILGNGYAYFIMHNGLNTSVQGYSTHNNYLEILVNYGIVGFVLYYSIILSITRKLIKYRKRDDMVRLLCVFMIIHLILIEPTTVNFSTYTIFYFLYYICYRIVMSQKKLNNQ